MEEHLRELAGRGERDYEVTNALRLPHLICAPSDIAVIPLAVNEPNFITRKAVEGEIVVIRGADSGVDILDGKIAVIESADPGFDWIFTRNITGLVTKYGGVNSHMAIRCAEFGLPAAIGCGEQLFERVVESGAVLLNCAEARITPLLRRS